MDTIVMRYLEQVKDRATDAISVSLLGKEMYTSISEALMPGSGDYKVFCIKKFTGVRPNTETRDSMKAGARSLDLFSGPGGLSESEASKSNPPTAVCAGLSSVKTSSPHPSFYLGRPVDRPHTPYLDR